MHYANYYKIKNKKNKKKNYFRHFCPENQCSENYASILPELQHMAIRTVLSSLLLDFSDHRSSIILLCYMIEYIVIPFLIIYHFMFPEVSLEKLKWLCSASRITCSSSHCPVSLEKLKWLCSASRITCSSSHPNEDLLQSLSSP